MIIDIGGGTTEVAVISLGGIVASRSIRVAGDEMDEDIINFARDRFSLLVGQRTAEEVKIAIGSATELVKKLEAPLRGRDLVTGLPKEIIVSDAEIREAIKRSVRQIVEAVLSTVEETPPELVADIMERGFWLTGGGALLRGLDHLLAIETGNKVTVADDPLTCVVRGTGVVLEDLDALREVLVPRVTPAIR
jgi:rod shape-determining protein MreB